MSRITHALTFVSFMFLAIPLWPASVLKIEVQVDRVGPIQYLPIYATIAFVNVSDAIVQLPENIYFEDNLSFSVQGPKDLSCYCKPIAMRSGLITLFQLPPGDKHIYKTEIARNTGMIGPGTYQVKVVWDSRKAPKGYKGYAESEWIPVIIEEAVGEDKAYLDAARRLYPDRYKCRLIEGIYIKEGFEKNPTSYYCGHTMAFPKSLDGLPSPANPNEIFQLYITFSEKYKYDHLEIQIDKLDAENDRVIEAIEAFLKAGREDFLYNDYLRADLAGRLAIQGKYERARSICEALIAKKANQEKNCSEFIQHLKEKGYLKQ